MQATGGAAGSSAPGGAGGKAGSSGNGGSAGAAGAAGGAGAGGGAGAPVDAGADGADAATDPFAGYHWVALPVPGGTAVAAVTLDSQGALYAGAAGSSVSTRPQTGGLFRSTDEGQSWRSVNNGLYDFNVGALTAVGTTVYAGTSELMRSTDLGTNWQPMTPPASVPSGTIRAIGAEGNLVMCADDYGGDPFYTSTDGGQSFTAGKYQSGKVSSLEVLLGGTVILRATDSGVGRSTDNGVTFNAVQGIYNGTLLGAQLHCDGVSTCYASAHNTASWTDPAVLMKSTDAGATWTALSPTQTQATVLAVSDTGILYITSSALIGRSDDGGLTFTLVQRPTTVGAFEPNCSGPFFARGSELYAGCPDGVYRSTDEGQHWQPASGSAVTGRITGNALYMFTDTSSSALGPPGDLYVVGADGVSGPVLKRSSDGGWTWQTVNPSFYSDACLVTPGGVLECGVLNPTTNVVGPARSADHGVTWTNIAPPAAASPGTTLPLSSLVRAGSVIYAATGANVLRSTDDGLSFQIIANSPKASSLQALADGHLLAVDGTGNSLRSVDGGTTWQAIATLYGLPVIEDPTGRLIRYTGASNFDTSTDEGTTWLTQSAAGLPLLYGGHSALTIDGAGNLFEIGPGPVSDEHFGQPLRIVASADGGMHFTPMPEQIPNPNVTAFALDKQGRLIAATAGGVYRLDPPTNPGPPMPTGGFPDGGASSPPRSLSLVLQNAPWGTSLTNPGFAADAAGNFYRQDQSTIYVGANGVASAYLTLSDVVTSAGLTSAARFTDLDMGPDGQLYVLLAGNLMGSSSSSDIVIQSNAAHQAALWRSLPTSIAQRLGALDTGRFGVADYGGLWTITAASAQLVYPATQLQQISNCTDEHLSTDPSGAFMYLPGCNGYPALRGNVDGSGVSVLYQSGSAYPPAAQTFTCTARDPAGGFYMLASGTSTGGTGGGPRVYHVAETGTAAASLSLVVTAPSLGEALLARGGSQFGYCSMAVSPDGTVYIQTVKEVWKIGP
jgi:hypothetical protein